jgi:methionyl-tRNA synthetase
MMQKTLKSGLYCFQCEVFLEKERIEEWDCWCNKSYCEKADITINVNTNSRSIKRDI